MAKLSEADLKREIKNSSFRKFYFLYGEEKNAGIIIYQKAY